MRSTGRSFVTGVLIALAGTAVAGGLAAVTFMIYDEGAPVSAQGSIIWLSSSAVNVYFDAGVTTIKANQAIPQGAQGRIQYTNGDGGWLASSSWYIDDAGWPGWNVSSSALTPPDAGSLSMVARSYAGRALFAQNQRGEPEYAIQEFIPQGWPIMLFFVNGGRQATGDGSTFGMSWSTTGTAVSDFYALDLPRGSPGASQRPTTTTSNQAATLSFQAGQQSFVRGNGNNTGGWFTVQDWAMTNHSVGDESVLVGLTSKNGALAGSAVPTQQNHIIFAGYDPLETVYKLCTNGATGTASCVSCGANFPAGELVPVTVTYRLITYSAPSADRLTMELRRLDNPSIAPCTNTFLASSGKLPNTNVFLGPIFWNSTASGTGNTTMRILKFYGVPF